MPFLRWTLAQEFTGCLLINVCFSAVGKGECCAAKVNDIASGTKHINIACASLFSAGKVAENQGLHHTADLWQHNREILNFFRILVKPYPKPNAGNVIVHRSGCSNCYSSSSTNFQKDEDEAGVEPRRTRNYNRPELTKKDVIFFSVENTDYQYRDPPMTCQQ